MPKQTFFNLPEEKRAKIVDVAIEEFASLPYAKASLSRIVSRTGIAKGSMYQYFEDKRDLFLYLLDLAVKEKMAYINQEVNMEADFFTAFEQTMLAGTRFSIDHPRLNQVMANAMDSTGEEVLRELILKGRKMTQEYFVQMLKRGQDNGSIRLDIDLKLTAFMISSMLSQGLTDIIRDYLGLGSIDELLAKPELLAPITEDWVRSMVGEIIKTLRSGLQPQ